MKQNVKARKKPSRAVKIVQLLAVESGATKGTIYAVDSEGRIWARSLVDIESYAYRTKKERLEALSAWELLPRPRVEKK